MWHRKTKDHETDWGLNFGSAPRVLCLMLGAYSPCFINKTNLKTNP